MLAPIQDPNSNNNLSPPSPSGTPSQLPLVVIATNKLQEEIKEGNAAQAIDAVRVLFQEGHTSVVDSSLLTLNPVPVVEALIQAFDSTHFRLIPPESLHLLAKTLRLFAELTLLRSNDPQSALSYELDQQPIIEGLTPHIKNAEKNRRCEVEFELLCAQEACRRWKSDDSIFSRYYQRIYGLLIGITISAATQTPSPFVIRDGVALLDELYHEKNARWYDHVLAINYLGGYTSSDNKSFKEIHSHIGKLYGERFHGRRSKILLGVVDTLADAVWSGDSGVQKRALRGGHGHPGLAQVAAVAPFPNDKSRNLWKVRYHAISHLAALQGHARDKTRSRAAKALDSLEETHKEVKERLLVLKGIASQEALLEAYHSSFTVDTHAWGRNIPEETLSRLLKGEEIQLAVLKETQKQGAHLAELKRALTPADEVVRPDVIPHLSLGTYIHREGLQRAIQKRLLDRDSSATALTVCHGMGGVGKTTLALYTINSDSIRQRYPEHRYWFRGADDPKQLDSQFHLLAKSLGLSSPEASAQKAVEEVKNYFNNLPEDYLIVFDNVDTPDGLTDYLPTQGGKILVTTRNSAWSNRLEIEVLEPRQSLALIKRLLKQDDPSGPKLSEAMGHHPLGLSQACAYILEQELTIDDFLGFLANQSRTIFESHPELRGQRLPESVATLWDMTFTKLCDGELALLNQLAYLSPDKIPVALLERMGSRQAQETLLRYALIQQREDNTFSIHRLLQWVVGVYHSEMERENSIAQLMNALKGSYVRNPPSVAIRIANFSLITHGEAVCEAYRSLVSRNDTITRAYRDTLSWLGNAYKALSQIAAASLPTSSDDSEVAIDRNEVLSKAREAYSQMTEINYSMYRSDHLHRVKVAEGYESEGKVLIQLGERERALEKYHQALATRLYIEDPNVIITYDLIGVVLIALERESEAIDLYLEGLPKAVEQSSALHKADCFKHLGDAYYNLEKDREADGAYREALAVYQQLDDRDGIREVSASLEELEGAIHAS